jgi:hypothetical protein
MTGNLFDGVVRFDDSFYASLARMLNEEPVLPRDMAMMGMLRGLGIEKGKEFTPDASTQAVLSQGIQEAHAWFMDRLPHYGSRFWSDGFWDVFVPPIAPNTAFTFTELNYLDYDARGLMYYLGYAPPQKLGKASFYLIAYFDSNGQLLGGENNYRLHVPPNVPAQQFWALTVYDLDTCAFIREMPRVEVTSYDQQLRKNDDGSMDIYIGPKPLEGKEANWIPTGTARRWFPVFRFYGPEKPLFEKTWKLPDVERMK